MNMHNQANIYIYKNITPYKEKIIKHVVPITACFYDYVRKRNIEIEAMIEKLSCL
jgi:hypothetical protein